MVKGVPMALPAVNDILELALPRYNVAPSTTPAPEPTTTELPTPTPTPTP